MELEDTGIQNGERTWPYSSGLHPLDKARAPASITVLLLLMQLCLISLQKSEVRGYGVTSKTKWSRKGRHCTF